MNILRKCGQKIFPHFLKTPSLKNIIRSNSYFIEPLNERSLIRVEGEEIVPFLQGLITNDMKHLSTENSNLSMYAMFLTKTGRVLYDSIIYRTPRPDLYIIECDKEISNDLRRHLRLYRVRRKIDIVCLKTEFKPWIIFKNDKEINTNENSLKNDLERNLKTNFLYSYDPRYKNLGIRLIIPNDFEFNDIKEILNEDNELNFMTSTNNYHYRRYKYGIGEGIIDLPPGKSLPLESNCDFLHGVSFHKGCYIGQELTARTYHTGVTRKRLMPLKLLKEMNNKETILPLVINVQSQAGALIGVLRGTCKDRALALLRVEQALMMSNLQIDGDSCYVEKPEWWPKILPTKATMRKEN